MTHEAKKEPQVRVPLSMAWLGPEDVPATLFLFISQMGSPSQVGLVLNPHEITTWQQPFLPHSSRSQSSCCISALPPLAPESCPQLITGPWEYLVLGGLDLTQSWVENRRRVGSQRKFWELFYQRGSAPYVLRTEGSRESTELRGDLDPHSASAVGLMCDLEQVTS